MTKLVTWALKHKWYIILALIFFTISLGVNLKLGIDQWWFVALLFLGAASLLYITHWVIIVVGHPVKRDWLLSKSRFVIRVGLFVFSIPLAIAFAVNLINVLCELNDKERLIHSAEVIYSDEIYDDKCDCWKENHGKESSEPSIFWVVYYHFVDPGNQHAAFSAQGRALSGVIACLGIIFLNGLLVSVLISMFDVQREKWRGGTVRYPRFLRRREHYVIVGGSEMDDVVVESIFNNQSESKSAKIPYIVILADYDVEELRNRLYSGRSDAQQRHIIIYSGSRTSKNDIDDLVLERAKKLFILGESGVNESNETMHDTYNMRCLKYISDYLKKFPQPDEANRLEVNMIFEHQSTFSMYQYSELSVEEFAQYIDFKPVNYYEMWAQKVLVCEQLGDELNAEYIPLEGTGIGPESDEFVHLVIVGNSRMGVALGYEAAHVAHYPNFETKHKRTRITFIDRDMDRERHFFMGRYKGLFELARHRYADAMPVCCSTCEDKRLTANLMDECYGKWVEPWTRTDADGRPLYEHLGGDFIDVEFEFIKGSVEMPIVQRYLADATKQQGVKMTVAICLSEPNSAVAAALYMPREVYNSDSVHQVLVYQRYDDTLFSSLSKAKNDTPFNNKIKPFGMISGLSGLRAFYNRDKLAHRIAKHYDNSDVGSCQYEKDWLYVNYQINPELYDVWPYGTIYDYILHGDANDGTWAKPIKTQLCAAYSQLNELSKNIGDVAKYKDQVQRVTNQYDGTKAKLGKINSLKRWSNIYNANTLWTKLRCVGCKDPKAGEASMSLTIEQLWNLTCVEHARWNMEQLLLSQMPMSYDQMCIWIASKDGGENGAVKKVYKAERIHPNICSTSMIAALKRFGLDDVLKYDVALSIYLTDCYEYYNHLLDNEKSRDNKCVDKA